jgi:protein-S-isoprenylcysteine O-methyltransferase Ste14
MSLEARIPPPLVLLIVGALMWISTRMLPAFIIPASWRVLVIALPFVLGALFAAPAIRAFGRAKTTINPVDINAASTLVKDGVFGVTRNPMYLGLSLVLLAWALFLARPLALLGPILFALYITRFQIIPEERALRAKFGSDFEDYARRVRRWI